MNLVSRSLESQDTAASCESITVEESDCKAALVCPLPSDKYYISPSHPSPNMDQIISHKHMQQTRQDWLNVECLSSGK